MPVPYREDLKVCNRGFFSGACLCPLGLKVTGGLPERGEKEISRRSWENFRSGCLARVFKQQSELGVGRPGSLRSRAGQGCNKFRDLTEPVANCAGSGQPDQGLR